MARSWSLGRHSWRTCVDGRGAAESHCEICTRGCYFTPAQFYHDHGLSRTRWKTCVLLEENRPIPGYSNDC